MKRLMSLLMCFAMVFTSPMPVLANGAESVFYCETQEHSHSLEAGCYTLVCESTDPLHVHTLEECDSLTCGLEEHIHTTECENPPEATEQSSDPLPSEEPSPSPTPEAFPSEMPSPSPTPEALPQGEPSPSPTPEILPSEEPSPSATTDGLPMMSMLSEPMTLLSSGTETVTIQSTLGAGSTHDLSLDGSSYNLTIDITAQSLSTPKLIITVPKGINVTYYPTASDVTLSGTLASIATPVSKVTDANGNTVLTYYFKANVATVGFNITLAPTYKLKPGSSYETTAVLYEDTVLQSSATDTITVTSNPTLLDGTYYIQSQYETIILQENTDYYYAKANGYVYINYQYRDHFDYDSLEVVVPLPDNVDPGYYDGEAFVPLIEGQARLFTNGSVTYKTNISFANASGTTLGNGKALVYSLTSEHDLVKNYYCYYYYDNMGGIYLRFPGTTTSGDYKSPYSASVRAYIDGNTESSVVLCDYKTYSVLTYNIKAYNISDYLYQRIYGSSTVGNGYYPLNITDAFSFYNSFTNTTGEIIEDIEVEYYIPEELNCYRLSFNLSADPNNSRPSSAIVQYRTKNNTEIQSASLNADDAVLTLSDTDAFTYVHVLFDKLGSFSDTLMTGYIINKSNVDDNTGYTVSSQILSAKGTGSISDIPIGPQSVYIRNFYLRTSYSITPSTVSLNKTSLSKGDNFNVSFRATNVSAYTTNPCIYMLMPAEFIFSRYNSPYSDFPYTVSQRDITVTAETATSYVPAGSYTLYKVQYTGESLISRYSYHTFAFTVGPEVDTATLRTGVYLPAAVAVTTENTMFPYSTSSSYNMPDKWDFDGDGDTAESLPTSYDHPTVTINAVKTITAQSFLTSSYTGSGENTSQNYQFNSTGNYKLYLYNGLDSGNTAKNATISITVPKVDFNNDTKVSTWNALLTGAPVLNGAFLAGASVTYSTDGGQTYSASVSDYANVTNIKIQTASDISLQSSESASVVLPFKSDFPEGTGSSSKAYFEAGFSYYLNSSTSSASVDIAPNTLATAPVTVSGVVFKDYNANGSQDSNEQNNSKYYSVYLYKGEYTSGTAGLSSVASLNTHYSTGAFSFSNIYMPGTYTVRVSKDSTEYFPETGLFTQDESTNDAYYTFTVDDSTTAVENINLGIVAPRTLTLNSSSMTLYYQGATRKIVPTITPALSDTESVTFSSSDESVVTVASDGTLTYVGDGNATITVSVPQLAALTGTFGDAPITSQVTVYARKTNYNIAYKDHSGSDITASLPTADYTGFTTYNYGSTLWLPTAEPYSRTGYTFDGWYTAQTGGSRVNYISSSQYGDQTVYARWTANSYSISYANMSGASYGAYRPYSHTFGTATTVSDPTKSGYEFMGWKINGAAMPVKNLTLGAEDYTSAITLTAVWSLTDPTVTIVSDNADNTVTYGTAVTLSALASHPINPAYTYAWYKAQSGGDTPVGGNSASLTLTDVSQSGSYYCIVSITDGTQNAQRQSGSMAMTINKAPGSVTNISDISKNYDAVAVNAPSYTKAGDGAVTIEYKKRAEADTAYSAAAPADAGDYTVRISVAGDDNHLSTTATKDFTISPRVITVTPSSGQTKVYGQADPVLSYSTNADTQVAGGQTMVISGALTRVSGENVDQYAIGLGSLVLGDGIGGNIFKAANYMLALSGTVEFTITDGEMSVSASGHSGVYDGELHGITVSSPAGATVYYKTGSEDWSLTNPLIKDVTTGATVYYKVEKPNYTTIEGSETVSITARPITLKASSASKMYDGSALTYGGYQIEAGSLAAGESITSVSMTSTSTITDCGAAANTIDSIVIGNGTEDVTDNYDITKLDGTLTISKRPVTIKADSTSKPYDGTPLTDSGYSVTSGSFAAGEGFAGVTVVGSRTLVGTSENVITGYELSGSTKAGNYNITTQNGALSVEEANIAIMITSGSASKTYDGKPLTDNSWSISSGVLAAGDEIKSIVVTGTITNFGSASNMIGDVVIKHGSEDVTSNYSITKNPGVLTINKRAVQITADSKSKTYDGTPLHALGYSMTKGSFADGEGLLSVNVSGEQTFAGVSDNIIKGHKLSAATSAGNYEITYRKGTLTVRKAEIPITVKASDGTAVYTGDPFSNAEFTFEGILAADDSVNAVTAGSITDVGTAENEVIEVSVVHKDGTDVTDNYVITTLAGVLTMESRPYASDVFSISSISGQAYTGDALKPQPVVKYNGKTLIRSADYSLSYKNNIVPGTAIATVNFSGNYSGTASVKFTINAPDVKTLAATDVTDTGAVLKGSLSPSVSGLSLGFYYKESAGGTWKKQSAANGFAATLDNLKASTEYVYYAFVDIGGTEYAGDEVRFTTEASKEPVEATAAANGKIDVSLTNGTQDMFTVTISIESGNKAVTSVTKQISIGSSFNQTFEGLEDGYYNIVARIGDFIETKKVRVLNGVAENVSFDITSLTKNTVVEVKGKAPSVAIGGMTDIFSTPVTDGTKGVTQEDLDAKDIEIKVVVDEVSTVDENRAREMALIEDYSENQVGMFIDFSVIKKVTDENGSTETKLSEVPGLLEIAIPIPDELLGKTGYVIYRVHDGQVNKITEDANGDGEYIEVTDDGYIILYVRKFSTYAIGYSKADAASAVVDTHHGYWWLIPVIVFVMVLIFIIMKKRKEAKG